MRRTVAAIAFAGALTMAAVPAASDAQNRVYQSADYSSALRLRINPNAAEVFIDGMYAGRVDNFDGIFQRLRVRPGSHDLIVYMPGYRPVRERVFVRPDETRTINLSMSRLGRGERDYGRPNYGRSYEVPRGGWNSGWDNSPARLGTVSLGIAPYDADVWVDGRRFGRGGRNERVALRLDPGRHRIEVRRSGYRTYAREVNVTSGGTITLNVNLRRS